MQMPMTRLWMEELGIMEPMRVKDFASREDIADIAGCLRAEYRANEISRQAFIEQMVDIGYDYFAAEQEADEIDAEMNES
jgi:hypothetical protein